MSPTLQTVEPDRASLRRLEVKLLDRRKPRSWLLHEARRSRDGVLEIALVVLEPDELRGRAALIRRDAESLRQWTYSDAGDPSELPLGATLDPVLAAPLTAEDLGLLDEVGGDFELLGAQRRDGVPLYQIAQDPPAREPYGEIVTWLHSGDLLPVRREFYADDGALLRRQSYDRIETTEGSPTPLRVRNVDLRDGSMTRMDVRDLRFERSLPDDLFVPSRLARLAGHSAWSRLSAPVELLVERGFVDIEAMPWEQSQRSSSPSS